MICRKASPVCRVICTRASLEAACEHTALNGIEFRCLRCGHHMKSVDKAAKLEIAPDGDAKYVDL